MKGRLHLTVENSFCEELSGEVLPYLAKFLKSVNIFFSEGPPGLPEDKQWVTFTGTGDSLQYAYNYVKMACSKAAHSMFCKLKNKSLVDLMSKPCALRFLLEQNFSALVKCEFLDQEAEADTNAAAGVTEYQVRLIGDPDGTSRLFSALEDISKGCHNITGQIPKEALLKTAKPLLEEFGLNTEELLNHSTVLTFAVYKWLSERKQSNSLHPIGQGLPQLELCELTPESPRALSSNIGNASNLVRQNVLSENISKRLGPPVAMETDDEPVAKRQGPASIQIQNVRGSRSTMTPLVSGYDSAYTQLPSSDTGIARIFQSNQQQQPEPILIDSPSPPSSPKQAKTNSNNNAQNRDSSIHIDVDDDDDDLVITMEIKPKSTQQQSQVPFARYSVNSSAPPPPQPKLPPPPIPVAPAASGSNRRFSPILGPSPSASQQQQPPPQPPQQQNPSSGIIQLQRSGSDSIADARAACLASGRAYIPPQPPPGVVPSNLRSVIIDGPQCGFGYTGNRCFDSNGILVAIQWFLDRGHTDVTAFLSRKFYNRANDTRHVLDNLQQQQLLTITPSRHGVASYEDRFILDFAAQRDGVVVSNDNFRDLLNDEHTGEEQRKIITDRVLTFCFARDVFMPAIDPLGPGKPSRDQLLSKVELAPERATVGSVGGGGSGGFGAVGGMGSSFRNHSDVGRISPTSRWRNNHKNNGNDPAMTGARSVSPAIGSLFPQKQQPIGRKLKPKQQQQQNSAENRGGNSRTRSPNCIIRLEQQLAELLPSDRMRLLPDLLMAYPDRREVEFFANKLMDASMD